MKYKTIGLYYGNGESNLIHQMSRQGWGLMNKMDPNYEIGQKEAFYTFVGGDDAKEIEDVDFLGNVEVKKTKENSVKEPSEPGQETTFTK